MMKKNGFTMAEVLITMGILGVIAAMTLPALMTNINGSTWMSGLKNSLSVVNNGFAQMMAIENADNLDDTKLWGEVITQNVTSANDNVKNELAKYFKIDKMSSGVPASAPVYTLQMAQSSALNSTVRFYLANSSTMNIAFYTSSLNNKCNEIKTNGGNMCERYADIYIDVNGDKRPNVFGNDIFRFYLSREGKLYPYGGDDVNLYDNNAPKWNSEQGCQGKSPTTDGLACTARALEQDKIEYQ